MNTWRDIVNYPKGWDADAEPLHIKFVGQDAVGEQIPDFGVGYVDGVARATVLHCVMLLLHKAAHSAIKSCPASNPTIVPSWDDARPGLLH
jgi:hypothetical protein